MEAKNVSPEELQGCIDEFLGEHATCSLRVVRRDIRHFEVILHEGSGTEKYRLVIRLEGEKDEEDERTALHQIVAKKQSLREVMNTTFERHGKPPGADGALHTVLDEKTGCVILPLVDGKFHDSYFVEDMP